MCSNTGSQNYMASSFETHHRVFIKICTFQKPIYYKSNRGKKMYLYTYQTSILLLIVLLLGFTFPPLGSSHIGMQSCGKISIQHKLVMAPIPKAHQRSN